MFKKNHLLLLLLVLLFTACKSKNNAGSAADSISETNLKEYISVLASDDFGGRAPSSPGEEKTINYLAEQFGKLGLEPANNGSFFQEVSLLKLTADPAMNFEVSTPKGKLNFTFSEDYIGGTPMISDQIKIDNSDMVFVGYGINAPEYNWNDYEGLDVKGKTVVMLVNDPGYATGDSTLFTGKAMTYYGRWTYKFEEAARQGARAAIIIHETGAAGYPWTVVRNSWSGPQFYPEGNMFLTSELEFKGWVTTEAAKKIFGSSGMDYETVINSAAVRGFKPFAMNIKASVEFINNVEHTKSNNVAALLPGSNKADEYIIYTAHWDHLGINRAFSGDSILNGAVDNATGTAALLEIARAFTNLPEKQHRSILFLAVTGEEQGLLGSEYYAENPIFPLNKTVGVINMDALNIFGTTKDMTVVGLGNSQLDNYAIRVLEKHDRYASPDPTPEKGGYFRSDHFSFAREGVPSLYLSKGVDNAKLGKEWGLQVSEKWIQDNYHKPSDNYEPEKWDFQGMIDDIKIYFEIGYELSITSEFPTWNAGFPFKPLREEMMKE